MAGLAAAHELVERGFDVTVFEPKALGRQGPQHPGAGHRHRRAARTCPASTASGSSPASTTTSRTRWGARRSRSSQRREGQPGHRHEGKFLRGGRPRRRRALRASAPTRRALLTVDGMRRYLMDNLGGRDVPPHELAFFVERLLVFLTSCDERRYGQWEHVSLVGLRQGRDEVGGVPEGPRRRPHPQPGRRQGDRRQHPHDRQHGRGVRLQHHGSRQRRRPRPRARPADQRGLDRPVGRAPAGPRACGS